VGTVTHDHPNEDRLTFGCPGCVERVRFDQLLASVPALDDCELVALIADDSAHTELVAAAYDEFNRRALWLEYPELA
jgi:hypothetical protein